MERYIIAIILFAVLLASSVLSIAKNLREPLGTQEKDIANAVHKEAIAEKERDRLRQLAKTDLKAAQTLHGLLAGDLAETRRALKHLRRGFFGKRRSNALITQFAEEEINLEREIRGLANTIERLRLGSGAA